ncbi:hypothetical protein F2P56_034064 [Juglans regia]|uniref:Uncharacterized protein LOC108992324 n=2 Tax=Juglans regia TaxID=51240 RepID=A0A2I4ESM2_JUGRE|nr:uncharacterized protein LOC108992324 [Juglans regia]KAF5444973.1 hypothetical protein F2P56_034064 [Juglans regia]
MKLLSWNVRGLGNPRGIRALCNLVKREAPEVLFLWETHLKAHEFEVCPGFSLEFMVFLKLLNVTKLGTCYELLDMGFRGSKFTWCNRRGGSQCVSERLDRALANVSWGDKYSNASVTHGVEAYSDHNPILVNTEGEGGVIRGRRQFRLEEIWIGEQACDDIIRSTWRGKSEGSCMVDLMDKSKKCGSQLQSWNKNWFGNVQKQLRLARQSMELLHALDPVGEQKEDHERAREELQKWMERDEVMWRQRSKALWLKDGDKNSSYFHMKASQRRRKNSLAKI